MGWLNLCTAIYISMHFQACFTITFSGEERAAAADMREAGKTCIWTKVQGGFLTGYVPKNSKCPILLGASPNNQTSKYLFD